jgi:hypothetical protein
MPLALAVPLVELPELPELLDALVVLLLLLPQAASASAATTPSTVAKTLRGLCTSPSFSAANVSDRGSSALLTDSLSSLEDKRRDGSLSCGRRGMI